MSSWWWPFETDNEDEDETETETGKGKENDNDVAECEHDENTKLEENLKQKHKKVRNIRHGQQKSAKQTVTKTRRQRGKTRRLKY